MKRVELKVSDGSWSRFRTAWSEACQQFDEDPDQFAVATMPVLEMAAREEVGGTASFALEDEAGNFVAAFWANVALIPRYEGPVLRVRHVTLSPQLDFGDYAIDVYGRVLGAIFGHLVAMAKTAPFKTNHIKLHLPSPNDRMFYSALSEGLRGLDVFSSIDVRGSWMYVTLN